MSNEYIIRKQQLHMLGISRGEDELIGHFQRETKIYHQKKSYVLFDRLTVTITIKVRDRLQTIAYFKTLVS